MESVAFIWFKNKIKFVVDQWKPSANVYLFKVNNVNTRTKCEICSKLEIKDARTITLTSNQQEADTCMILYKKHVSSTYNDKVLFNPDTDVFMTALPKMSDISAILFILTGTADKRLVLNKQKFDIQ